MGPLIEIKKVTKAFDGAPAVDDVTLSIEQGELFALLGPSGCGKSTLLRMLAGFETPQSGQILIDGVDMTGVPPYARPVNMMFQNYALFPHMNVEQNILFGLRQDKSLSKTDREDRLAEMLELVELGDYRKRRPNQLSGGQRQRVALARSLAKHPKVLLLDEPLAALDRKLRERTQLELVDIQERVGITFVMVTHDQEEAMTMAGRIGVMNDGEILQVGSPNEVYEYPSTRFVADFIGRVNMFEGDVTQAKNDRTVVQSPQMPEAITIGYGYSLPEGGQAWVAVRPEKIRISKEKPQILCNVTPGVVEDIVYVGSMSTYMVRLPSGKLVQTIIPNLGRHTELPITWEDAVWVSWAYEDGVVLAT